MYTARSDEYAAAKMARTTRLAILGGTLLILVAGTALATQSPRSLSNQPAADDPEGPPSAEALAHARDRLRASNIDVQQLSALAEKYGLGGAIRLLAWADAKGISLAEVRDKRDSGMGWGQIAKEPGLSPGIGSVMGQGGGHGPESAPGLTKEKPAGGE